MSDLSTCPNCGGVADNGHDREHPPTAYLCKRCSMIYAPVFRQPAGTLTPVECSVNSGLAPNEQMTDRELLELAAKAAGYDVAWIIGAYVNDKNDMNLGYFHKEAGVWNPLASDGDALRLARKLEMTIDFCEGKIWHNRIEVDFGGGGNQNEHARRAITKVAAEIGKGTP